MLKTVLKYMPLKATMREVNMPGLPSGAITFLGVVSSQEYQSIIVNAKVSSYRCLIHLLLMNNLSVSVAINGNGVDTDTSA